MYILIDPITNKPRYVGKAKRPKRRFKSHTSLSRLKNEKYHNAQWLKSLLKIGLKPRMIILEKVPDNEKVWEIRENFWMDFYRRLGFDLTNTRKGGGHAPTYGRLGSKWTKKQRENYKLARKGVKIGPRDTPMSPLTIEKIKESWRKREENGTNSWGHHSQESKNKIGNANRGKKWNDEQKIRSSISKKGKIHENTKSIETLDNNGNLIKIYLSPKEASLENKILKTSIFNCLNGRSKSAGGFKWKYHEDSYDEKCQKFCFWLDDFVNRLKLEKLSITRTKVLKEHFDKLQKFKNE